MTALTLDLVKSFLGYEKDQIDHDDTLTLALEAGVDWVERYTGHILRPRTFHQPLRRSAGHAALDNWPVTGEPTLSCSDGDVEQIIPLRLYSVCRPATVRAGAGWPSFDSNNPATIVYTAGYTTPDEVPAGLLHGVLLYAGMFEQLRSNDASASLKPVEAVCWSYRLLTV
ncbi:phage gp6-like head-tail connector protein [Sphingomonas sp. CFBP 13720]|uniref:phage gp6-like head-tail connector protein n=1 Tax=Sphingomonas sp. CFBP 13720 TaxID=2775302 RepID=UPI00178111E9|nr:phage gp6-like head-tail connector protein [Sphingomonas sp. CFBP 13720]MBD8677931.1 phage gp6-like head-tail connector protein [Sphingomonas sp. CFBP 13720]